MGGRRAESDELEASPITAPCASSQYSMVPVGQCVLSIMHGCHNHRSGSPGHMELTAPQICKQGFDFL